MINVVVAKQDHAGLVQFDFKCCVSHKKWHMHFHDWDGGDCDTCHQDYMVIWQHCGCFWFILSIVFNELNIGSYRKIGGTMFYSRGLYPRGAVRQHPHEFDTNNTRNHVWSLNQSTVSNLMCYMDYILLLETWSTMHVTFHKNSFYTSLKKECVFSWSLLFPDLQLARSRAVIMVSLKANWHICSCSRTVLLQAQHTNWVHLLNKSPASRGEMKPLIQLELSFSLCNDFMWYSVMFPARPCTYAWIQLSLNIQLHDLAIWWCE